MQETVNRYVSSMASIGDENALRPVLNAIADRLSSQLLVSGGLAIGTATTTAKIASTIYATANGTLVSKATVDLAALSGSVTNARFNVYCWFMDAAGTVTSAMGTEGTTLALVKFPTPPVNKAMIGFIVVNPTGTGPFVGGTTPLGDVTVVPNVVYVNTVGAFDPTILL